MSPSFTQETDAVALTDIFKAMLVLPVEVAWSAEICGPEIWLVVSLL